ncbi:hypothetical protein JOF53_001811 [Crossiella equi]|uniref:Spherulation-specific family 4 n=1 Tax=Crossiella equi TaxID=130796 RepID=A0ABS5A8N6_9PSEU|nr:spherulation-specific family 4 protein [Crossiella equi]MBP2472939.1 hypothetical protein [Crossiella equi]
MRHALRTVLPLLTIVLTTALTPLPAPAAEAQRVAVPSYFRPGPDWQRLEAAAPTTGLAVVNPHNGPGASPDPAYAAQVASAHAKGLIVLGYVSTRWGARPEAEIRADVDRHMAWYGVGGIFLDETTTDCAHQPFYERLYRYIRGKATVTVVLNPGASVEECYLSAGDVLVTFEADYRAYTGYQAAAWTSRYPAHRFWHLVHGTPREALADAVARAKGHRAGWFYATPDPLDPNPWARLPEAGYWAAELALVRG